MEKLVDQVFIVPTEHRPKPNTIEAQGIPIIDLSMLNSSTLVKQIGEACKNWGFFQVINHGVPMDCFKKIENATRKFFALSMEEKRKVRRDEFNPMGFFEAEETKGVRDWKEFFDFAIENNLMSTTSPLSDQVDEKELKLMIANQWPECLPNFRKACEEYVGDMEKLCYKLLEVISLSLGLPANRLNDFFEETEQRTRSLMRLNYYPVCRTPHLVLGVGPRKDGGVLTVLAQDDVSGLEVKRKADGEWIPVKPNPNAYTINIGNVLQVWSNGKYESVEHRVKVNSKRERFSFAFFFSPAYRAKVEALEELIDEQNHPKKFDGYIWGDFITAFYLNNFKIA